MLSPIDGSPILRSARTASTRTSLSRSSRTAATRSGIAAPARRMPNPRLASRRTWTSGSLIRARSASTTTESTGMSGSTTASSSSSLALMKLPILTSVDVGPVERGRCRFTRACTARSRMSFSLSLVNCTKPGSARISSICSSDSSASRRTEGTGSLASATRSGVAGACLAMPS